MGITIGLGLHSQTVGYTDTVAYCITGVGYCASFLITLYRKLL